MNIPLIVQKLLQVKCTKYWPDLGIEKECGNMKIRLEKEKYFASHAVRSMKILNKAVIMHTCIYLYMKSFLQQTKNKEKIIFHI